MMSLVSTRIPAYTSTSTPVRRALHPATAWLALLPAAAAMAVGYLGIAEREMWEDEYATFHAADIDWTSFGRLMTRMDLVHGVYYLLVRAVVAVFGDSLTALRLPSLLAMGAAAGMLALLGRRLISTQAGIVAGLVFAAIPAVSRYGQEARSYALVTAGALAATLLLLRAMEKPTPRRWITYAACLVIVGLTHFVALAVLGAHLVYVLLATPPGDVRRPRLLAAAGSVGLLVIPLLALASHQASQISWIKADLDAVQTYPGRLFLSARVAILLAAVAAFGTLVLWRRHRPVAALLAVWAAAPPVLTYVTFPWLHLFLPRYALFTLPAWSLLAAAGACGAGRIFSRRPHRLTWIAGALLLLPGVVYVGLDDQHDVRLSPVQGQPDYRAALLHARANAQPGDAIVYNDRLGGRSDLARAAAEYELRGEPLPDILLAVTAAEKGTFGAQECADPAPCLGETARIWLITTVPDIDPTTGMSAAKGMLLREGYAVREDHKFSGVRAVLLVRTPGKP